VFTTIKKHIIKAKKLIWANSRPNTYDFLIYILLVEMHPTTQFDGCQVKLASVSETANHWWHKGGGLRVIF